MARHDWRGTAWTRDDILLATVETYSLLPRPSRASTDAFLTLLREYWPTASAGTRAHVETALRGNRRIDYRALEALDELTEGGTARTEAHERVASEPVETDWARKLREREARLRRVRTLERHSHQARERARAVSAPHLSAAPPARAATDEPVRAVAKTLHTPSPEATSVSRTSEPRPVAEHARELLRHLAVTGEPGPSIQIPESVRRLRETDMPWVELAVLLRLPSEAGNWIVADARGSAVALRALGVPTADAVELVDRWHHGAPDGFAETFESLSLEECLKVVSTWRNATSDAQSDARHVA